MANGHGGKRVGAGKKKGSHSKRAEESMALAAAKGVDPVEMLLDLTKWAYEQFQQEQCRENADMVRDYAKECAPYVRPKLASIEVGGEVSVSVYEVIDRARARASIAAPGS